MHTQDGARRTLHYQSAERTGSCRARAALNIRVISESTHARLNGLSQLLAVSQILVLRMTTVTGILFSSFDASVLHLHHCQVPFLLSVDFCIYYMAGGGH